MTLLLMKKKIRIFPNPVNNQLEIQFANFSDTYLGTIYDLTGKKVHSFNKKAEKNSIDVSFLKSGFYILNIQSGGFSKNFKILKNGYSRNSHGTRCVPICNKRWETRLL